MAQNNVTEAGIAEALTLAKATPQRLAASSAGLDDAHLSESPASDVWSPLQILNHLRACEEVWMHSVHAMLAHDDPRLQEIHPRQWIKQHNPYTTQPFTPGLRVFTLRREALLITLGALSVTDWGRAGRIQQKTHTVFSHVWRMVQHEKAHCAEIEALLG
ncbi:MAG: DinB family protein [Anaerolineaceae bacterium]|nr:DinB family protein [Anaerolineaceae bacterium]